MGGLGEAVERRQGFEEQIHWEERLAFLPCLLEAILQPSAYCNQKAEHP